MESVPESVLNLILGPLGGALIVLAHPSPKLADLPSGRTNAYLILIRFGPLESPGVVPRSVPAAYAGALPAMHSSRKKLAVESPGEAAQGNGYIPHDLISLCLIIEAIALTKRQVLLVVFKALFSKKWSIFHPTKRCSSAESNYNAKQVMNPSSLDRVMKGFKKLFDRWLIVNMNGGKPPKDTLIDLSPRQIRSRQDHIKRLNSILLPDLQQQMSILSKALHPPNHVWNNMSARFDNLLNIQSEFSRILSAILSATKSISRRRDLQSIATEDHCLKEFKYYMISNLEGRVECLFFFIGAMLNQARTIIEELNPMPNCTKQYQSDYSQSKEGMAVHLVHCGIEDTFEALNKSDLDLAQRNWAHLLDRLEGKGLGKLMIMLDRTPTTDSNVERRSWDPAPVRKLVHEPVIYLAKSSIPLFKLSRIFLQKLSKRGMSQIRFPVYTTMSSDQLQSLADFPLRVSGELEALLSALDKADTSYGVATIHEIEKIAESIKPIFESAWLLALHHIVPLIPDTNDSPTQNYWKNWLIMWNTQFDLAISKFIHAAKAFEDTAV
ncbi:hypothetical protein KEM48_004531 [Puccinia striiformis f. sp. tritici PST-130]|uniref:Uncharacterized protein n=2 Tax=Puccinia striiformis TaxID=27350 RepID=A0A0L0VQQ6_9BASI|nr:hypothetical protein KEM48_004531 [Puccinia striiformis f. sp. tritici PST-130]KNF01527.1 hypothetical protein PSTG_05307 [Puccinia striiformis f. sp. tritici PST-78]